MFCYYLKLAIRNFQSKKLISWSGILTISFGALCLSLLTSYIINELTMDNIHKRKKDIYMMVIRNSPESKWHAITASSFFNIDYREYPEIENSVTVEKPSSGE